MFQIYDDHAQHSNHIDEAHGGGQLLAETADGLDAAQQNHAADDGRRHGGNPCGNSQAVLHSGGHGIGLGERSGSQAAQNDSDRENDGQGFPLSAHSPLNVVHGAAIINAVLSLDSVRLLSLLPQSYAVLPLPGFFPVLQNIWELQSFLPQTQVQH